MPWLFLAVTVIGAGFTFNAYFPRKAGGVLSIPSFFAGWLTSELAAHHFAWQLIATGFFVWAGALEAWPGWLALAITFASWGAMLALVPISHLSGPIVEAAINEALGSPASPADPPAPETLADPTPPGRLTVPFLLYDPEVTVYRDLRYAPGAGKRHLLDIYAPRSGTERAPVLLQIHGGGWVIGQKREQALPLMLHLAARGWICVAVNYRLSPKATFPDHLIDLKLALGWIKDQIHEYGGDPEFIVATGGSAGGHLSSLLALTANEAEYQPGFEHIDTRVQACVPFYGVYDMANRFGHDHFDGFERFLGRIVFKTRFEDNPEAFRKASPVYRVNAQAPPFFVIHGTHDSLAPVEEARGFVKALREVSQEPVAYAEIPGAQHAFEVFHSLRTRRVVDGVDRFVNEIHARHRNAVENRRPEERVSTA